MAPEPSWDHSRSRRPFLLTAVAVVLLIVGIVMFARSRVGSSDGANRIDSGVKGAEYPVLIQGLCQARSAAEAGQNKDAYNFFYARSHFGLHVLVADVVTRDRPLAGRIQQAKAAVEQDLATFSPKVATDLEPLIAVAAEGLSRVGAKAPIQCSALTSG